MNESEAVIRMLEEIQQLVDSLTVEDILKLSKIDKDLSCRMAELWLDRDWFKEQCRKLMAEKRIDSELGKLDKP